MRTTLDAATTDNDRETLTTFCLEGLQSYEGFSDGRAESSGERLRVGEDRSEQLLTRESMTDRERMLVGRAVDLLIHAHGGNSQAAVMALGGTPGVAIGPHNTLPSQDTAPVCETGALFRVPIAEDRIDSNKFGVTPEAIGRYEVHGELGRGGLGCVLIGLDMHVRREVAIKRLLVGADAEDSSQPDSSPAGARFLREARLTAQLEHPSIVPVYEVGRRPDGTLYYTMRLVRGRTLAAALRACDSVESRLRLLHHFADVCGAVAFAHSRGVIHRDIKPHNVMIGEFTETVLIDWGLAKIKSEKENRTFQRRMETLREAMSGTSVEGKALGTPEYMPPEQAFGDMANIDETSDVYSMGAVLYNLLTGQPPFVGRSPMEVLLKVQRYGQGREHLVPARTIAPEVPPELAAIAEKALQPHPQQRYQSAKELLDEINAFREGRKVSVYTYSRGELFVRLVRKNRVLSFIMAAAMLMLLATVGVLVWGLDVEASSNRRASRDVADAHTEKAEFLVREKDMLGARVYAAAALRNSRYNKNGAYPDAELIDSDKAHAVLASLQSTLVRADHLSISRFERSIGSVDGEVDLLEFSPDSMHIATAGTNGWVRVWKASSGELVASRKSTAHHISAMLWAPDAKTLYFGEDDEVKWWKTDSGQDGARTIGRQGGDITAIVLSPDKKRLASASKDWSICLWDLATEKCSLTLKAADDESYPAHLRFNTDGTQLMSAGMSRSILVWDATSGALLDKLSVFDGGVNAFRIGPDKNIWALDNSNRVRTLHAPDYKKETGYHVGPVKPWTARMRLAGEGLFALARANTTELWDLYSGRKLEVLRGHANQVRSLSFSPDGRLIASADLDGRVNVWSLEGSPVIPILPCQDPVVTSVSVFPDGSRLLAGDKAGGILVWDLRAARVEQRWKAHNAAIEFVSHLPDASILSVAQDGTVRRWSADGQAVLSEFRVYQEGTATRLGFALAPDGKLLAAGNAGFDANLWRIDSGELIRSYTGHKDRVGAIAFSPDGSTFATGSEDKTVRLWNIVTGQFRTIQADDAVRGVAFSHDGTLLAKSDLSNSVAVYYTATLEEKWRSRTRHPEAPRTLRFSPDGTRLASTNASDTKVNLWDVAATGKGRLVQYADMPDVVRSVTFLPQHNETMAIPLCAHFRFISYRSVDVTTLDPAKLLEDAERRAGMRLDDFNLVPYDKR